MLEKRLDFQILENELSSVWKKNKTYKFKLSTKKTPYTIIMPPPNVTGSLHMGHALTFTLQDILIRFNKKLGKNVLWQPGTDHAGIATEIVVEKQMLQNIKKTKKDLGRKAFIKKIWEWKENSGNQIINQLERLGTSVDWSISKFTLDNECSETVKLVFIDLYNKGLIYQDKRLVNWDPVLETAISDLEVNQKDIQGNLWYIKYKIENTKDHILVATTRPETMFGDAAIAIHPKNPLSKKLKNKRVIIPLTKKSIPIIFDKYADPKKGSGLVKITPAHDFNDFIVGKKHKLKFFNIFDSKGNLNEKVPKNFFGLNRFEARKKIIKLLKNLGQIEKITKNKMVIPVGDRSGAIIEPYLTEQWYLDSKKLCKKILTSIEKNEITFYPKSWMNTFKYWIKNIEPWCISRQIWWGHRIPIWHTDGKQKIAARNIDEAKSIIKKKKLDVKITHQDFDVLDTWFSSALWPFSTLGWPKNGELLKKHYPSDVLVTGFDIIFFWVARMIMMGLHFKKKIPFKNIYIHPLVKDEKGEKMSKSKGNVIDPLELINSYGADSLRFTLTNLSTQGRDIKLSNKLVENSRNFMTKVWNVARFSQFNNFNLVKKYNYSPEVLILNDWIVNKLFKTKKKIFKQLNEYKFNLLVNELYQFVWHDFCDLYIEFCKAYMEQKKFKKEISSTFSMVFKDILNLLNPIIPFITEKICIELNYNQKGLFYEELSLDYLKDIKINKKKINDFEKVIFLIKAIRSKISGKKISQINLFISSKKKIVWIDEYEEIIKKILNLSKIVYSDNLTNKDCFVISNIKFYVSLRESQNSTNDNKKLIDFYKKEIIFFETKLNNKNFIEKAPKKVVDENKKKLLEVKKNLRLLTDNV